MAAEDLYHILQVDAEADVDVIEAAYRALARKYHPDVYKQPDAHRRMQALNDAYGVLHDPLQRAAYDRKRARALAERAAQPAVAGRAPRPPVRPAPAGPTNGQPVRANERTRRQNIAELNAAIHQLQEELDQAARARQRHRATVGLVYLIGALLIVAFLVAGAGAPHLTSSLLYTALAIAATLALFGAYALLSTVQSLRDQRRRIARLQTQIRQRRHNLGQRAS
jgi:curved DNA-binding protein CbpA